MNEGMRAQIKGQMPTPPPHTQTHIPMLTPFSTCWQVCGRSASLLTLDPYWHLLPAPSALLGRPSLGRNGMVG